MLRTNVNVNTAVCSVLRPEQVFYLQQPILAANDTTIEGTVAMVRQADNPRLYNVKVGQSETRQIKSSVDGIDRSGRESVV